MRFLLIATIALLSLSTPALSAEPVSDFTYRYQIIRNGSPLGSTQMQFKALPNRVWQYSSQAIGTEGLASLTGASVQERSLLIAPRGHLELHSNRVETQLAWKTEVKSTEYDAATKTYIYRDRKATRQVPYQPGLLDQHSLNLAMMADLRANKGRSFVYPTIHKGKLETMRFKVTGDVVLHTALGELNCVRVERVRDSANGKTTRIWFAKERGFTPVLIQQLDTDGDDIEMRIQALE